MMLQCNAVAWLCVDHAGVMDQLSGKIGGSLTYPLEGGTAQKLAQKHRGKDIACAGVGAIVVRSANAEVLAVCIKSKVSDLTVCKMDTRDDDTASGDLGQRL